MVHTGVITQIELYMRLGLCVGIMICLTSVECHRATISTGIQTATVPVILTISGPSTSPFSIHRNVAWRLSLSRSPFRTLEF